MANVIGSGIARTLVDVDGDPVTVTGTALDVNIASGTVNLITGYATSELQGAGLPSALSSDNLKVSIKEGNISGFATSDLQPSLGTAGSPSANIITVQGKTSMTPLTVDLAGNNDIKIASGQVASGAFSSGSIASGAIAAGAIAAGAVVSGAVLSGAFASGSIVDGAMVTLGAKTDAKNTATNGTSVSGISVLKQISASVQTPPSRAVTNAGTFAVQADHGISSVGSGSKTIATAGTPAAIGAGACKKVDIKAYTTNTKVVAIGASDVDAAADGTGVTLRRGDTYSLEIDSLAEVYLDVLEDGEGVRFTFYG